jgi:hypothetical protein
MAQKQDLLKQKHTNKWLELKTWNGLDQIT